jgi:hypothetical protein
MCFLLLPATAQLPTTTTTWVAAAVAKSESRPIVVSEYVYLCSFFLLQKR